MCFGNATTATTVNTPTPTPAVASAATQNLSALENLQNTGYQPYTGNQVAPFSGLQNTGFGVAAATPSTNPYAGEAASAIGGVLGTSSPTITANSIASQMSPYMNQYVSQALAPQLQSEQQQFAGQDQALNAAATSSGAFGDARTGIQAANLTQQQDIANTGLVGQAYTNAFNTAIGAGAQDVANNLQAQQSTAQLGQAQQGLALSGAGAAAGLGTSNLGYATGLESLLQGTGGIQQQEAQAQLNVPYQQYLAAQQYPFLTSQALDAGISSGAQGMPPTTTSTTTQPNNSGYALLGALAPSLFAGGNQGFSGSAIGSGLSGLGSLGSSAGSLGSLGEIGMFMSDERVKENIKKVGKLDDGTPIKTFNYKADPQKRPQIGLVAQDVEKKRPEAVREIGGIKHVNLIAATGPRKKRSYVDADHMTSLESAMGMAA